MSRNLSGNAIPRCAAVDRFPLSFAQQGLWLTERLAPGNSFNNIVTEFSLRGDLRVDILQHCLDEIISRHEILRTVFIENGEDIFQFVQSQSVPSLRIFDLAGLPAAAGQEELA